MEFIEAFIIIATIISLSAIGIVVYDIIYCARNKENKKEK